MKILKNIITNITDSENFVFVSIGANDGIFVDEIFQSSLLNVNWICYFIEPVEETFNKLVKNYNDHFPTNNFHFKNYAIYIDSGLDYLITYKADDSKGMCSFLREENETTEKIQIKKKTFADFVLENNITKIDFLKIDCEGLDYEIILQCLENSIQPELILFEDISTKIENPLIRGRNDLINLIEKSDDYVIINDIPEYQYEESNKLIIKKELLKYVQNIK